MDRYAETVSRLAFRILCDHADSEEVAAMVLEALRKRNQGPDSRLTLSQWLMSQTVRLAWKRHRQNRVLNFFGKRPKLYVQTAPKVDDADDYITTQAWEIYCRASEELTIDQRIVYVLRELEGLSEEDVMKITGFWRGTVRIALEISRAGIKYELSKFGKVAEYEAYVGFLKRVHYICGTET